MNVFKRCFLILTTIIFIQPCLAVQSNSGFAFVPDLISYSFTEQQQKLIVGTSTETATGWNCNSGIKSDDQIGNLAIVATFYQNGCYTDGRYNNNNYLVRSGVVSDATGKQKFVAYNIAEPTKKATQFLASAHVIYYKFPTVEAYSVYSFNETTNEIRKIVDIAAKKINTTTFVKIATLNVSGIKGSISYLFVPSTQRLSTFTALASNIEAALVADNDLMEVSKFRYSVTGKPFDTRLDFNFSPTSWLYRYSLTRQFFIVYDRSGQIGIIWQDKKNKAIKLTRIASNNVNTTPLVNSRNEILAAATFDNNGALYYMTVKAGDGVPNTDRTATLYKTKASGELLLKRSLNTSKEGLNIVEFFVDENSINNVASLKYANGALGLMLGRKMHQSNDGLNHQGGIAVVYSATTLKEIVNWGQTSGHSFENVLTSNSANEFIAIDLGDKGVDL